MNEMNDMNRTKSVYNTKGRTGMTGMNIAAAVLIIAGIAALAYGSFTYSNDTHDQNIGPMEMSVKETSDVNIPVWAGVGAIVVGGVMLLVGTRQT